MVDSDEYLPEHEKMMHKAIKKVTSDIEEMKFNTSVATFMTMVNEFYKDKKISKAEYKTFLQLLNPFAPHMTEELFEEIGEKETIANTKWPEYDEEKTIDDVINLPVQVNGKLKVCVEVSADGTREEVIAAVKANQKVQDIYAKHDVKKEIYVPGKIFNIVV